MAKSRRASRSNRKVGVFQRFLGNPVATAVNTVGKTAKAVTYTTGNVINAGLGGISKTAKEITSGANKIVKDVVSGKNRKSRKASRKNRKSRKANRK
jgi:hypothetical protein